MRPYVRSQTGVGIPQQCPMEARANPFSVSVGVVVTGTVTYTVEHTHDNIQDPAVTVTWFPHATLAAQSATAEGYYAFPVTSIRLNVTAGTGTAKMTVTQGENRS